MIAPLLLAAAGAVALYYFTQKPSAKAPSGGLPDPRWYGKAVTQDFGGLAVTVMDDAARLGITRALLRDEIVAMQATSGIPLWSARLAAGVGGQTYTGVYVDPAKRGLQFVGQSLLAGRDVYVPVEWASGDLTKPLPRDPDRSEDLYSSDKPLDPMLAKYWALLYNAPKTPADLEAAKADIQVMLTAPSKDLDVALAKKQASPLVK